MNNPKGYAKYIVTPCLALGVFALPAQAQVTASQVPLSGRQNTITTAVPFLMITPDARAGGMGDVGVATPDDVNALHWNMAKYAFNESKASFACSYTPWLRTLVPDISLTYLSAYYKVDDRSAVAVSFRYFTLGSIQFTNQFGQTTGNYTPKEYAIDIGYSLKLSPHFSFGTAFRFINSDLAGGFNQSNVKVNKGIAFSGDITAYYTDKETLSLNRQKYEFNYGFGAAITNLGSKISYSSQQFQNFIPINLRLGTYGRLDIDKHNSLALAVDINKLLVPSNPVYARDSTGVVIIQNGKPVIAIGQNPDVPVMQGVWQSFSDAPGGWREELHEINVSAGLEYWLNREFALRMGHFYEHRTKGNRQYYTFGGGLRFTIMALDIAYMIPAEQRNPLERTFRFTFTFNIGAAHAEVIKNIQLYKQKKQARIKDQQLKPAK